MEVHSNFPPLLLMLIIGNDNDGDDESNLLSFFAVRGHERTLGPLPAPRIFTNYFQNK